MAASTVTVLAEGDAAVLPSTAAAYRLGPEDIVTVSVWKNPELSQEQTVRPDGKIGLKLIGELHVLGQTLPEVQAVVSRLYLQFIPEAEVTVTLKEMNSFRVYVLGKVARPGEFKVRSTLTALQALALAGGFTPYARVRKIKIYRETPGAGSTVITFDYQRVVAEGQRDIQLQPGDRLVVP